MDKIFRSAFSGQSLNFPNPTAMTQFALNRLLTVPAAYCLRPAACKLSRRLSFIV